MALTREQVEALIAASERIRQEKWWGYDNADELLMKQVIATVPDPEGKYLARSVVIANFNTHQTDWKENRDFAIQSRNLMPQLAEEWKQKDAENRRVREALSEIANHDIDATIFDGAVDSAKSMQLIAEKALADINTGRHKTPQQSLADSLKEMQAMRKGEIPKRSWREFQKELDAGSGADAEDGGEHA